MENHQGKDPAHPYWESQNHQIQSQGSPHYGDQQFGAQHRAQHSSQLGDLQGGAQQSGGQQHGDQQFEPRYHPHSHLVPLYQENRSLPLAPASGNPNAEEFYRLYPNGLYHGPRYIHDGNVTSVPTDYEETALTKDFYLNGPKAPRAVFSTDSGRLPPRFLGPNNIDWRPRRYHLNSAAEIQHQANHLRRHHSAIIETMDRPATWYYLWTWWDAQDIYDIGPTNCWNILNHMYDENQIILRDQWANQMTRIGEWADRWMQKDLHWAKLGAWLAEHGDILDVLSPEEFNYRGDREFSKDKLSVHELAWMKQALIYRSAMVQGSSPSGGYEYPQNTLVNNYQQRTIHNWLGEWLLTLTLVIRGCGY
jgi:hypothetical protein